MVHRDNAIEVSPSKTAKLRYSTKMKSEDVSTDITDDDITITL
jgi:hypothetical protein